MKEPLGMVQEEPACAPVVATTMVSDQPSTLIDSAPAESGPKRKPELLVLTGLLLVALFCTTGTYYWHARAWPSPSLWDTLSLRESDRSPTQAGSRFKEYQRWVPIRKGDYVVFANGSAANARMITGVPRESVVLRNTDGGNQLIVLGANSFMVRTAAGGDQIIRRSEIATVISAQTASR